MLKIIAPGSYDFGDAAASIVKLSSRGLRGHDRSEFEKRAAHQFVDSLGQIKLAKDEVPVHLIALGSTEKSGVNRNGDGFRDEVCEKYHDTFEKYAKPFRDHKNRRSDKHYGRVIKSAFNRPMGRVELLIGYNGGKDSIEKNGGEKADKEIEKLASGKDLAVSMSCRVSRDFCSGCQNEARTRDEYCDESMCKYGGLKRNIAKVAEDGHVLHADNPDPMFFDISHVFRPADRIAYAFGRLEKSASGSIIGGAELAELAGITMPPTLLDDRWMSKTSSANLKVASELADFKANPSEWDLAFSRSVQPPISDLPHLDGERDLRRFLGGLSQEKIALPLIDFLALVTNDPEQAAAAAPSVRQQLPAAFAKLASDVFDNPYVPDVPMAAHKEWAHRHAPEYSIARNHAATRVKLAVVRGIEQNAVARQYVKEASDSPGAAQLAKHYAMYKIAFLASCTDDPDFNLLTYFVVRQSALT